MYDFATDPSQIDRRKTVGWIEIALTLLIYHADFVVLLCLFV